MREGKMDTKELDEIRERLAPGNDAYDYDVCWRDARLLLNEVERLRAGLKGLQRYMPTYMCDMETEEETLKGVGNYDDWDRWVKVADITALLEDDQ
jgi:hypothetical protein